MQGHLNAAQLRDLDENHTLPPLTRYPLYFIIDNIYDTYNIGGLFRLGDALAIERIYICGDSEVPPHHRIQKSSVGTYKVVPWTYKKTAYEAITEIRSLNPDTRIVAVELDDAAVPYTSLSYLPAAALIIGNESHGVAEDARTAADAIARIPMYGYNTSLNAIVAASLVAYHAQAELRKRATEQPA